MRAIYFKITNDLFFYNKKTLIFFCALPFIISLFTLAINGNKISIIDFFPTICFFASGALIISLILEMNDFSFQKFSSDKNVYSLSSKKYKNQCYNESINRISQNEITINNLHINEDKEILKFLTNFNLSFIEELKKSITFERFDEYLITNNSNKTSGNLFFTLYKISLLKTIKDFIINTNYLENASDNMKQQFIYELTSLKNLHFNQNKGLHYDDKFVINFFEQLENCSEIRGNISKEFSIQENQKTKRLISSFNEQSLKNDNEILSILKKNEDKIEQENIINKLKKEIKTIKINKISKYQFYKVLEKISIDVLKVKLTKENIEELKSFVGIFFISDIESKFQYQHQIKKLSFINPNNSTDFILSIKYLIKSNLIENNMSRNMQNLDKIIEENAYKTTAINRAEIFRINLNLKDLSSEKIKNIDAILQTEKIKLK